MQWTITKCFALKGEIENWWEPSTEASYKEKAQCIIEQYGNYEAKQVGLKLNGINNQGENIADNGGLKEAYKAYRKLLLVLVAVPLSFPFKASLFHRNLERLDPVLVRESCFSRSPTQFFQDR